MNRVSKSKNVRYNKNSYVNKLMVRNEIKKELKKEVEYKRITNGSAISIACNTSGSVRDIFNPGVGTLSYERIGTKANITSIEIKGYTAIGTPTDQAIRLLLVKSVTGSTPAVTDVLEYISPSAPRNDDNINKYIVLWDKVMVLGVANGVGPTKTAKYYKRMNVPCVWTASNVHEKNAFFLIGVGSLASGATSASFECGITTTFTDL